MYAVQKRDSSQQITDKIFNVGSLVDQRIKYDIEISPCRLKNIYFIRNSRGKLNKYTN
jgi:hypothetical protein